MRVKEGGTVRRKVEAEFWAIWTLREIGVRWADISATLGLKEKSLIQAWFRLVEGRETGKFRPGPQLRIPNNSPLAALAGQASQHDRRAFKTHAVRENFNWIAAARHNGQRWDAIGKALGLDGETVRRVWQRLHRERCAALPIKRPRKEPSPTLKKLLLRKS